MSITTRRARWYIAVLAVAAIMVSACGEDDGGEVRNLGGTGTGSATGSAAASGSATGSASGVAACEPVKDAAGAQRVDVALNEWTVAPAVAEVRAGKVLFSARNAGKENHELVVARGDNAAAFPVKEGKVDEDALPAGALKGEIESFAAGKTCEGAFDLEPGTYVLFCNIVEKEEDGTIESHFEKGMSTTFTARA